MASQPQQPTTFPRHGLIRGGLLDGWHYAYVRLVDDRQRMQVYLHVLATPPGSAWPFPKLVKLRPWQDFKALVRNPRARLVSEQPEMLDFDALLAIAVQRAIDNDPTTPRAWRSKAATEAASQ